MTRISIILFSLFLFFCNIASTSVSILKKEEPIARELSGGESHTYQINLIKDQFASIIIEQRGIDLKIQWSDSSGNPLLKLDDEVRIPSKEVLDVVTATTEQYLLVVSASSKSAPRGSYEIRVSEIRDASDHDVNINELRKLENLWTLKQYQGAYQECRQISEQALTTVETIFGKDHRFYANWLQNLAEFHDKKHDFAKSIPLREQAYEISKKLLGEDHFLTIQISRSLAFNYFEINDVSRAEKLAARALELAEKTLGPEHYVVAKCLHTFGLVTGDRKKSEESFQRALKIVETTMGTEDYFAGAIWNAIGMYNLDKEDFPNAEKALLRSKEINDQTLGPANVAHSMTFLNLGMIARQNKDYVKAENYYKNGIDIIENAFGPDNPRLAMFLNNLANVYRARGEYEKSLETHLRVLRISEVSRGRYHPLTLTSLGNIARTYAAQNNVEEAIRYQARVDEAIEHNIELNLALGSERQKLSYINSMAERTDRTISLNVHLAPQNSTASDLGLLTVLQRKGRVLDAMSESFASLRQRSTPDEQALLQTFNETTTELAKLVLNGPQRIALEEHQKAVLQAEGEREKLEEQISNRSAEFRAQWQAVTLDSVQDAIPSNAALIEYAIYRPFDPKAELNSEAYKEHRYIAYVLRREGKALWQDLGSVKEIDLAIHAFRKALRDPKNRDVHSLARALDQKIMEPLRPFLGGATHLLISPDGALNFIPIEALVDEENQFLVEKFSCSYLTSGRDLLRLQVPRNSKSNSIVMANPIFGEPESPVTGSATRSAQDLSQVYFAGLTGSAQEAEEIKTLFPESTVFTGDQATESAIKQASAPRILHIATHGFFLTDEESSNNVEGTRSIQVKTKIENPLLRSGLALAGANLHKGSGEDGILTALEASGLNLWGTKLVTLSACDTGVGELKSGEGVYGLRRAFVLAGTETLVMSLWQISDYITRQLMGSYYKGLQEGLGRGEALRQTQLQMLGQKGREHPYYWAAFVQSGEWANLQGQR